MALSGVAQLVAYCREEHGFGSTGLLCDAAGIVEPADENRRIARDDDEPHRHADGEVGVGAPDGGYENDTQKQNHRDYPGAHQPGNAKAEAIAEDGPQEQGIEDRAGVACEIHHQADGAEIGTERDGPAHRVGTGPPQDVGEEAGGEDEAAAHCHECPLLLRHRPGPEIEHHQHEEDEAIDAHLVLAVRPSGEARPQPGQHSALPRIAVRPWWRRLVRVGGGIHLMPPDRNSLPYSDFVFCSMGKMSSGATGRLK